MNKIEQIKAEKDGLDVKDDLLRYAKLGVEAITDGDFERLKWYGIFYRRRTPSYFMMRVRISNGMSNARQVDALAHIINTYGRGTADITTRQQMELRWLQIQDIPTILDILHSVGLSSMQTGMDNIRNVVGCPVAGINPSEVLDASPVAHQLTAMFVNNREFTNLPRKFNVVITGCRDNCVHAESQDIALVPASKRGRVGFNVLVGGKMGSGGYHIAQPLDVFVAPEEAAEVCAAITLIYRDHGPREARSKARLAFLLEERGVTWLRDELERRWGRPLEFSGYDQRSIRSDDHIGVHPEKRRGFYYVGLMVPVGRITGSDLLEVARLASNYGSGEVRFTVSQNIIVSGVPSGKLSRLLVEPILSTLSPDPTEIMRGLVSCTGIDYCNLALIETKELAMETAIALEQRLGDTAPFTMYWSGCPAGCGNHHLADIGLEGKRVRINGEIVDAVDIYMGGRSGAESSLSTKVMESVPCSDLPDIVMGLLGQRDCHAPDVAVGTSHIQEPVVAMAL